MELSFFVVMTLLSVHAHAELKKENLTLAGLFNETTASLQESVTESINSKNTVSDGVQGGIVTEHISTTVAAHITDISEETTQSIIDKRASTLKAADTTAVHSESEKSLDVTVSQSTIIPVILTEITNKPNTENHSLPTENASKITQVPEMISKSSPFADEATHSLPIKNGLPSTTVSTVKVIDENVVSTTETNSESQTDSSTSIPNLEKTTKIPSPDQFFKWLDSIHPDVNATERATVTVKNIIDTSIISTEKLIIVISTICGTFVLFVVILIAISCCRRNRNLRSDSEKSDFSVTSVVSIPDKRKSDSFSSDKNGFNNSFMGIPANNEVWKSLEQLSPVDSSVMPESTKM